MALKLVASGQNTALVETALVPSPRSWGTWKDELPVWALLERGGERIAVQGRFRLEVVTGETLVYEGSSRVGTLGPGVSIVNGEIAIYCMKPDLLTQVVLTRL